MSKKILRTRHSSLEMHDTEGVVKEKEREKKKDMLSKARNKLYNLSDALKSSSYPEVQSQPQSGSPKEKKSRNFSYFLKPCPNKPEKGTKPNCITNGPSSESKPSLAGRIQRGFSLKKQHSVGAYPIKHEGVDMEEAIRYDIATRTNPQYSTISRLRPATICGDKVNRDLREAEALALERPRKKLSFREPEIMGHTLDSPKQRKAMTPEMRRSTSLIANSNYDYATGLRRVPSADLEDCDLESQAMTVVRTVGQAFEVCHKWSITEPKNNDNADEQDTLTQDLVSDRLSDITSDKPKKDVYSEGASDKFFPDDDSFKDVHSLTDNNNKANKQQQNLIGNGKSQQLDVLLPPPTIQNRISPLTTAETYAAPHSDVPLTASSTAGGGGGGSGGSSSIPAASSALSVHHELQLLREQLDQQSQQTQAACAQLQLAREQLAAEQSARMEAQARTHQLLVHNRELLDHIAALVAHLQGSDKAANLPQSSPHLTMPQQHQGLVDGSGGVYHDADANSLDHSPVLAAALGLNPAALIENRAVTSVLPTSPLRTSFNPPPGGVFNFPATQQQPQPQMDFALESQLLQRLQALSGYTPPAYYNQNLAFLPHAYANPMVNNNYTLAPPPQKKFTPSPLPVRHSFQSSPVMDKRLSPARNSDVYQSQQSLLYQSQQNLQQAGFTATSTSPQRSQQNLNQNNQNNNLQILQQQQQQQQAAAACRSDRKSEPRYIKPLSQMGTLTTTDPNGRVRVIVPVPSGQPGERRDDAADLLSTLRLDAGTGPGLITRSTSEKVPNRSEAMSLLNRTWTRHTTK